MPRVILALPAYNEAPNLPPLLAGARASFERASLPWSVIVVNDGSTDDTGAVLDRLAAGEFAGHLTVVQHEKNQGLGGAMRTVIGEALSASEGEDIIVNMDSDNTHDPAYIPGMCEKIWEDGWDVVIASRYQNGSAEVGVPFGRRVLSRVARWVFRVTLRLPGVRDYTCGFRAYRRSVLAATAEKFGDRLITRNGFACTDELLLRVSTVTRKITEVPFILYYDRKQGSSKMALGLTIAETLRMILWGKK